jgi:molybdopterin/thiamine biosynthesis adenylyltransferase
VSLSLTDEQHRLLVGHLFPEDGCEAVAILLCGRRDDPDRHRLVVREVHLVPYAACSERTPTRVTWPTEAIVPALERAGVKGWSVVKIHGHPSGFPDFSEVDDRADRDLFPSIAGWVEADVPHASAVMLYDGRMRGRLVDAGGGFRPLSHVMVVGDNLRIWHADEFGGGSVVVEEFARRHAQAFGAATTHRLRRLAVAVVGCSGTGSPVIEMLARLGVGRLVLVDPDSVEEKNLNRILNSTMADARGEVAKVDVMRRAVEAMGLGTEVMTFDRNLFDPDVVRAVAACDVVFGCVDSAEGRYLLNRLATFYTQPYFDVGIRLETGEGGVIDQVCGTVHYLQPGRSSLLSRGLVNMETVRAEGMKRRDPEGYELQRREKYIAGVDEDRPAVISVNMLFASLAVNELLARLHGFRDDPNSEYASVAASLTHVAFYPEGEGAACKLLARDAGRGDVRPLLDVPELSEVAC